MPRRTAGETRASVRTKPSVVAMLRLDHAGALGHAGDANGSAAERDFGVGDFGDQVGGHDGARDVVEFVVGEALDKAGNRFEDQLGVELDADHAGRGGEHLRDGEQELSWPERARCRWRRGRRCAWRSWRCRR